MLIVRGVNIFPSSLEQIVLDGLEADVEKNHDDITGLSIKAATIGGAAGVIGALGFGGGWSWLSGLFK
jgi:hypothetical protein